MYPISSSSSQPLLVLFVFPDAALTLFYKPFSKGERHPKPVRSLHLLLTQVVHLIENLYFFHRHLVLHPLEFIGSKSVTMIRLELPVFRITAAADDDDDRSGSVQEAIQIAFAADATWGDSPLAKLTKTA